MTGLGLYTLGDAEGDWEQAIANLHNLALTIGEARKAGQIDAANALLPQMQYWLGQARAASQSLYGDQMPSSVMMTLSAFSDFMLNTGATVVKAIPAALGGLVAALGLGIVVYAFVKGGGLKRGSRSPQPAAI